MLYLLDNFNLSTNLSRTSAGVGIKLIDFFMNITHFLGQTTKILGVAWWWNGLMVLAWWVLARTD
jgi:hypothetical protein